MIQFFHRVSLILAFSTLSSVTASASENFHCSSGGFAYNTLDVKNRDGILEFVTNGISLMVTSKQFKEGDYILKVSFSIPEDNCNLEEMIEDELTCSLRSLKLNIKTKNQTNGTEKIVVEKAKHSSLILKKVFNGHQGIKLFITHKNIRETLALSNSFSSCVLH